MSAPHRLYDMHCHLDRMANADEVIRAAAACGIALFDATVTPDDAVRAAARFAGHHHVRVGVGLHPWWLADGSCTEEDVARAVELAATSAFIGEIGLDFGRRGQEARELQCAAFERIVAAVAAHPLPHRVLTLHAVAAAEPVLDALERHGLVGASAPEGTSCIFHGFSGSSDELVRARRAGCYFSVSERMLASKRGRAYARQIPTDRLLLETDAPPQLDTPWSASDLDASLTRTLQGIAALRGVGESALGEHIARTSERLFQTAR